MKAYSIAKRVETNEGFFNLVNWQVSWPVEALSELASEAVIRDWIKNNLYLLDKQKDRPTKLWVADSIRGEFDQLVRETAKKYEVEEFEAKQLDLLKQIRAGEGK